MKETQLLNSGSVHSSQKVTKPFILGKKKVHKSPQNDSLYWIQHIYLHAMTMNSMNISWGSEVTVFNPKNNEVCMGFAFSSQDIGQNTILLTKQMSNKLHAHHNDCILVTYQANNKATSNSLITEAGDDGQGDSADYVYDKNQFYELLCKIVHGKLKIQVKISQAINNNKIYTAQISRPINNISPKSILNFLTQKQNYHVFPYRAVIEIIVPKNDIIILPLCLEKKQKMIDTQIMMSIITDLTNFMKNQKQSDLKPVPLNIQQIKPRSENLEMKGKQNQQVNNQFRRASHNDRTINRNYLYRGQMNTEDKSPYQFSDEDDPTFASTKLKKRVTGIKTQSMLPLTETPIKFNNYNAQIKDLQLKVQNLNAAISQILKKIDYSDSLSQIPKKIQSGKISSQDQEILSLRDRFYQTGSQNSSNFQVQNQTVSILNILDDERSMNKLKRYRNQFTQKNQSVIQEVDSNYSGMKNSGRVSSITEQNGQANMLQVNRNFQITENKNKSIKQDKIKEDKNQYFIASYKLAHEWSQVCPFMFLFQMQRNSTFPVNLNMPALQDTIKNRRVTMKINHSKNNFLFFGIVNINLLREKYNEKSLWKQEGVVGIFGYNAKIYYNGESIDETLVENSCKNTKMLFKSGDSVEVRMNQEKKEISWLSEGQERIKAYLPQIFSDSKSEQQQLLEWVPYVQFFTEGDTIEFFLSEVNI